MSKNTYLHEMRMNSLARVMTKVARVMLGNRRATVASKPLGSGDPIAASQGVSITLNSTQISPADLKSLTEVWGLFYHEVGHALYSPAELFLLLSPNEAQCMNLLEDQRQERLLVAAWPRTAPYLASSVMRYILGSTTPGALEMAHVLTHGRTYLDPEIRKASRAAWNKPDCLADVERIIDEFLPLVLPLDMATARKLAKELTGLLLDDDGVLEGAVPDAVCHKHQHMGAGGPGPLKSADAQALDQAAAEKADLEVPEGEGGAAAPGDQESTGERREKSEELKALLAAGVQKEMDRADVQADLRRRQKTITDHELPYELPGRIQALDQELEVDSQTKAAARRFEEELRLLADHGGAAWERATSSGRLNAQRAMSPTVDIDGLFDSWGEEGEGHDLEVVTLIDRSGSMDTSYWGASSGLPPADAVASACAWIIDRGVKAVEGSHWSFAFDGGTKTLYRPDERPTRAPRDIKAAGGTMPLDAVTQAAGVLLSSRRRNKVLLIVTDGDWAGDVPACHQMIRDLRAAGVQTALAYLTTNLHGKAPDAEAVRHECEMVEVLDVTKLPRWAAEVVSRSMEKKNRRA